MVHSKFFKFFPLNESSKLIAKYSLKRTLIFLSWLPVLYEISEHVVYLGKIEGISMKPTFNPSDSNKNDYVLLWKWDTKNIRNLKVGDVIFLRSPINPENIYTKRIKALQGEMLIPRYPDDRKRVTVPLNHIWVEGDNIHSIDSNTYGPVSTGMVIGKASWIVYPFNRWGPVPPGGRECRESALRSGFSD